MLHSFIIVLRERFEAFLILAITPACLLGLLGAALLGWSWTRFGHRIDLRRFFQVTGIFVLLFLAQIALTPFHEFSEAGLLPQSEVIHAATEACSPGGIVGTWFSLAMVAVCGLWLLFACLRDRASEGREARQTAPIR